MIRRFNYTGRKKIPRSRVRIRAAEDGGRRRFDAELGLEGMDLPSEARIFVEAYHRSAYRRFAWGTIGDPRPPAQRWLDGIAVRSPLFRVKVVRQENGVSRILAAADRVVPEEAEHADEARVSLLPVEYGDLGDRVWALELDSDGPRLWLNNRFESIREAARSGPEFVTLVYPEVFRAVLDRALEEGRSDPYSDEDDWGTLWLRFACLELGRPRPPDERGAEADYWMEEAVNAFCARCQVVSHFERMLVAQGD